MTNFEVGEGEEASKLYPEMNYTRTDGYLKIYLSTFMINFILLYAWQD